MRWSLDAEKLRALWSNAVERAEIPGGYWAVLTHPLSTEDLARQDFGEVHILSHLLGAANGADIRRLRELESENVALQEKVARQQSQLRDAIIRRDATIAGLNEMFGKAIDSAQHASMITTERADEIEQQTMAQLIGELRRLLAWRWRAEKKWSGDLGLCRLNETPNGSSVASILGPPCIRAYAGV